MNIVRITRTFPPIVDGTSIHMYELSKYQDTRHDLSLIVPKRNGIPAEFRNVYTVKVNHPAIFYSKFEKILFHFRVFILHSPVIRKADLLHIVGDLHDIVFAVLLKFIFHYKIILSVHGGITQKRSYRVLAWLFMRFIDKIYVTSGRVALELSFAGPSKLFVTTSGINYLSIPKKKTARSINSCDICRLITVGRLHEVKAYEDLIQAVALLDESFTLTIIGLGPQYNSLTHMIASLRLNHRVCLSGEKTREEIYSLLTVSDLFVMSSVKLAGQEEGTPTAMMEAMGAGLPIISTDTGGVRDLLSGYPEECIVPQRNPQALSYAISRVARDMNLRQKLQDISLATARSKDWSIIAKNITDLFESLCGKNKIER